MSKTLSRCKSDVCTLPVKNALFLQQLQQGGTQLLHIQDNTHGNVYILIMSLMITNGIQVADKQMITAFFFIKRNCGKIFRRGEGKSYKNEFVICECLQLNHFISVTISLNMGGICRRRWSQFVVAKGYNIPELHKHLS